MKLKSAIAGVLLAAIMTVPAYAATAHEVKTKAAPNEVADNGVVYGIEETDSAPTGSLTGAAVCVVFLISCIALPGIVFRLEKGKEKQGSRQEDKNTE